MSEKTTMPKLDIDAAILRDCLVYSEPRRLVTRCHEKWRVGNVAGLK